MSTCDAITAGIWVRRNRHFILELFARLSRVGVTKDWSFQMPPTQELIGDALGLTPIHVNRTVRSLQEDQLIAIDGKRATILDYKALALLSDFENSYLAKDIRVRPSEENDPAFHGQR